MGEHFLVVTGEHTHYLRAHGDEWSGCRYHDIGRAAREGKATPAGVGRSLEHRSFFQTGEPHFCGHSDVRGLRTLSRNPMGRLGAGPEVLCHIDPFERQLCCRNCAFLDVCADNRTFSSSLPCRAD